MLTTNAQAVRMLAYIGIFALPLALLSGTIDHIDVIYALWASWGVAEFALHRQEVRLR